jgi:uncharacterized membrane protein
VRGRRGPYAETSSRSGAEILAISILAFVGIVVSGYLSYTHLANTAPYCVGYGGCEFVNASVYSAILGIPIAYLGMTMYVVTLALGVAQMFYAPSPIISLVLFGISLAGTVYSIYLACLEVFVLWAVCLWCSASGLIIAAVFVLSVIHLRRSHAIG